MIDLYVPGKPAPQGSLNRGRGGKLYHASPFLREWRGVVASVARAHVPDFGTIRGPVELTLVFEIRRPLSHYRNRKPGGGLTLASALTYPRRPDLSKLIRAVEDGLVTGGLIADDAQVIALNARKAYSSGEGCHVLIAPVHP